uniref:AlNc14C364G11027 protein n=1 Tax=Albugo laibachii Nc14 TaxID=890382 RepID=F0WXU0_9STRA|nr:AlNc14C364G11027 [Albugo laibachii Nc14]|eukprot:CCA26288.1 AlNc14C364G11027 [Albugo laibachii Nc14]
MCFKVHMQRQPSVYSIILLSVIKVVTNEGASLVKCLHIVSDMALRIKTEFKAVLSAQTLVNNTYQRQECLAEFGADPSDAFFYLSDVHRQSHFHKRNGRVRVVSVILHLL